MSVTTLSQNRITAGGIPDGLILPDYIDDTARRAYGLPLWKSSRPLPPVVAVHGANLYAPVVLTGQGVGMRPPLELLSSLGFVIAIPSVYGYWGNAACQTAFDASIALARANGAHPTAPAIFIGASMGGGAPLKYAVDNPAKVLCTVGMITALDWDYIILNDAGGIGQRSAINIAWGRSAGDTSALSAGINPYTIRATTLATIRQQHWVSTDDPISANYATYAAATGCDMRTVGALGHTEAAVLAASTPEIVRFITAGCLS